MPDALWLQLLTVYGPLGLGWPIAIMALWKLLAGNSQMVKLAVGCINKNTEALIRFATLFEARERNR